MLAALNHMVLHEGAGQIFEEMNIVLGTVEHACLTSQMNLRQILLSPIISKKMDVFLVNLKYSSNLLFFHCLLSPYFGDGERKERRDKGILCTLGINPTAE